MPVGNVEKAAECYVNALRFDFDWGTTGAGSGASFRGGRMFLTSAPFRQHTVVAGRHRLAESRQGAISTYETNRRNRLFH